ncbi:hypothetical protein [Gorillibacterium sp. CAU 1737]|uniref:hypothetical protein n=1 Tax=Gorillibacterium sp. CAU 1737 TaxID=3140362 RepID=UPI003261AE2A
MNNKLLIPLYVLFPLPPECQHLLVSSLSAVASSTKEREQLAPALQVLREHDIASLRDLLRLNLLEFGGVLENDHDLEITTKLIQRASDHSDFYFDLETLRGQHVATEKQIAIMNRLRKMGLIE